MAFSKHVTNYGAWSGRLYYNLTTTHREGKLYGPSGDVVGSSMGHLGTWLAALWAIWGHGWQLYGSSGDVVESWELLPLLSPYH